MAKRFAALAAMLSALALTAAVPAGAQVVEHEDLWTGVWRFTADGGESFGRMTFKLADDEKTVKGRYTGRTNGRLEGELNRKHGRKLCGNFVDESGENSNAGDFCATIGSDDDSFSGWYDPCLLCRKVRWRGSKLHG